MAAIDVPFDAQTGGRFEVPAARIIEIERHAAVERHQREQISVGILFAILFLAVFGAIKIYRNRSRIAKSADGAIVSSLAGGVKATRLAAAKRDAFVQRVLKKADEKTPSAD